MRINRLQFKYRASASRLHQKVGNLLRSGNTFAGQHEAYQEYPVNQVNPTYKNGRHRFDWVIPHLKVVIEVMGRQHTYPTAFDGDYEKAVAGFEELKARDVAKKEAALTAGFVYIMVPYGAGVLLDENWLAKAYERGQEELEMYNEELEYPVQLDEKEKVRKDYLSSKRHQKELRLARKYRKRCYRRLKEFKKERDGTRP